MAPTVAVNGLTMCHMGSGGIATSTLPDICRTPTPVGPVPVVYVNVAMDSDLVDGSETVHADGGNPIAVEGCKFAQSMGNEPGSNGGVLSGVNMGEASFISFSPDVTIEGRAVCRLSDKMIMNKQNSACMAGIVIPPVVPGGEHSAEIDGPEEEGLISVCFDITVHEDQMEMPGSRLTLQSSDDNGAAYSQTVSLQNGGEQVVDRGNGNLRVIFSDILSGKKYTCTLGYEPLAGAEGAGNLIVIARNKYIGSLYNITENL